MNGAHMSHKPTIEVRSPQPDAALVVLGGEHDVTSANELRRTLAESLVHCDHLIVNLSATEFIDARTITVLMETRQHAIELDRKFTVVLGTEPIVKRILEVSGVLSLLNVVPTVERAFDASASPSDLVAHAHQRDRRRRRLPECLADAVAGDGCVGVPVDRPHELAAVSVPELQGDHVVGQLEDVEGVPAEVVAGRGVEVDVPEPGGAPNAVPVVRARRRPVVRAAQAS